MPAIGTKFGPYEIVQEIGTGGMGEVYRARDSRIRRDVAIKLISSSVITTKERLHRFEQEARTTGSLNHPNILAVYDVGTSDGSPYLVTELLEGETLRKRMATGAISVRKVIDYAIQIAQGLTAAHSKGIVHRDLKPENIFITKDGRIKILDFGLAKLTQPEETKPNSNEHETISRITDAGIIVGTVAYMSPEQIRSNEVDHRSDLFAFGIILYEMLSRKRPFSGQSNIETMNAILEKDPPEISSTNPDISPAFDQIIQRCLEKDQDRRFQSTSDLAFALQALSVSSSGAAIGKGSRVQVSKQTYAIAAVLLLVAVVVSLSLFRTKPPINVRPQIKSLGVLPLVNLTGDPQQEYFADGMTEALITDLSKVKGLKVISRTSMMQYKERKKSLPEIARELKVDAIVEGSVMRSGDRVRITAQLIQASSDTHVWGESYERNLRDSMALQGELSQSIARSINVNIRHDEKANPQKSYKVNPEAYESYLKGRYFLTKWDSEHQKGIKFLQDAINKDPGFALAYVYLASAYAESFTMAPKESLPKANTAIRKALEIDDTIAEAHSMLADIYMYEWKWADAEKELKRAIELKRNSDSYWSYACYFRYLGRFNEAVIMAENAVELDPVNTILVAFLSYLYLCAGRHDDVLANCQIRQELDANPICYMRVYSNALRGRYHEAITEMETYPRPANIIDELDFLEKTGWVYGLAGNNKKATKVIERMKELSADTYVDPVSFALIYSTLSNRDRAFELLEQAYREHSPGLVELKNPFFERLRFDPRYQDLVRRIGFPE